MFDQGLKDCQSAVPLFYIICFILRPVSILDELYFKMIERSLTIISK
jgi:hypothetical protein